VTAADTGGVTVVTIPGGSGPGNDGWVSAAETWTYSSADGPTGVFTVAADVTAKYSVGMRVRYVQTTTKYGIVTKVSTFSGGNTTVTIYGGTDYTTANAAISANYYSTSKAPFGFPLSPAKWTETVISTADDRQANPTNGTWYNDASLQISVPIGVWNVRYSGNLLVSRAASSDMFANATLSTANNSESDANWTIVTYRNAGSAQENTVQMDGLLTLTAKTTHYLNVRTLTTSITSLGFYGPDAPTIIRAVCAYL
jgi:hypothetical protein